MPPFINGQGQVSRRIFTRQSPRVSEVIPLNPTRLTLRAVLVVASGTPESTRARGAHLLRFAFLAFCLLSVLACFALPALAANLFSLVDTGELYRSSDGGATWAAYATLPVGDAVGLAASTTASDLTIVTRSGSIYQSTDGGANWSAIGTITASDVASFTVLPDATVLVLTESGTLYASGDGGASFNALAVITASNCVSVSPGPLRRVYALTGSGEVYESQDDGVTWTPIGAVTASNAVAISRKATELFVLTETGEVYRSLDNGVSWLPVGAITASNMSAMLSDGASILAAARTGEIYQSPAGSMWTAYGTVNQLNVVALGSDVPLATDVLANGLPPKFAVRPPYPNPALSASGIFLVNLNRPARVRLELYDVRGRLLAGRAETSLGAGLQAIDWAPRELPAGQYVVRYIVNGRASATATWTVVR